MCQPQKCNARFQRLAIRLNHGLSWITRILRSPERLSRNRGILVSSEQRSGTGTRTNKGVGRARGTRTNIGHGDPNEHRTPERTSDTGTRTNIGHGDPNEHRTRGPERTKGVSISESRDSFDFKGFSVHYRSRK